ncbi:GtrA family protein [Burkholderia stagnalis]|uniref:GtrA family protein n=1 Tax=Burkholderia stagnalis TaxID=1503054 RepID=UPI000AB876C3|nr:GtrA family protein [Burkholderia stagnalis]
MRRLSAFLLRAQEPVTIIPRTISAIDGLPGRFLRFVLVGGLCTLLNLLTLWFVTTRIGWHYLVAVVISFLVVNGIGFALNKYFTFTRASRPKLREIRRYYAVMLGTLALNLSIMFLLVDVLGIHYLLASIVITVLFTLFNFVAHSGWTFTP